MFVLMDYRPRLEDLRRSIAMLPPQAPALDREKAMALLAELQAMEERLRRMRDGLERLLDEDARPQGSGQ